MTAQTSRLRAHTEHGFTLVELLVAMAAGMVVLIGLFTIVDATLRQSQRTFTRVDATRRARTALANIENELHSACVAGSAPIEGVTGGVTLSDANNLVFVSSYGTAATPTPVWHQIAFNAAAGTLTDTSYAVSGTAPNWTRGAQTASTTLLTNVHPSGSTPVFQYYAYTDAYTAGSSDYWMVLDGTNRVPTTGLTPNQPLATSAGLSANDASSTVEVAVNLLVGASAGTDHSNSLAVADPVTDSVSLRLTTPPDSAPTGTTPTTYGPCQ
jgi:prepilin-type N-terminal cleavage/methylation domain-containing protein